MRLAGKALLLLSLGACARTPERLRLGSSDTVVVNSREPVALPVHAFDRDGRELRVRRTRFTKLTGDDRVRISDDGVVTCLGRGDAQISVTSGARSVRGMVRCEPIRGFRYMPGVELVAGGPPQRLAVAAVGIDGAPVTAIAGRMSVRDTTVVRLADGSVFARARGETFVDVEAGDCATAIHVDVLERVATPDTLEPYQEFMIPSLRLGVGESRRWRIPVGRFDLRFEPAGSDRDPLVLAGVGLNCARFPGEDAQHYSCVSYGGGTVVVRHPGASATAQSLAGRLLVRRLADQSRQSPSSNGKPSASKVNASNASAPPIGGCVTSF